MTATTTPNPSVSFVNFLLGIKPLANLARNRARAMMIKRAENIGVPWRDRVTQLKTLNWEQRRTPIENPAVHYPDYYHRAFHAYDQGNLSWEAALEVEVAAYSVHAMLQPEDPKGGDAYLRSSYHNILQAQIPTPQRILDLGCSVGMSTFALQDLYPEAEITGLDLSPYFLAVAQYNSETQQRSVTWHHAAAEQTGLPAGSFDLVSASLIFHELPCDAARAIFTEARRLLRPGGHFAIMDMNPRSPIYGKMPPYIFTLLKSTEPYLDQYFTLNLETELPQAGFTVPTITPTTIRHRAIVAQAC
ncbi:class I SAM-dependent methyltransferase [Spirulina sp. CCNP1310]|uniref:class I SAM-dependent methyltransferase n=1 Tax=Spirulina sp. CCNP1310 TaxID=3110249 RepID=UPI002B212C09|nr:class I SAM-dependent methyltransferase [Spirulina sp. CCNP1310]MEA5420244.1 class I SAM-dependent methyltransferase [Spirulina sp. CCNP1310]